MVQRWATRGYRGLHDKSTIIEFIMTPQSSVIQIKRTTVLTERATGGQE